MDKVDFRSERKDLYSPSAKDISLVDVPGFVFLMIDGHGNPNTAPEYAEAVKALYTLSYTAKFASKAQHGRDYVVAPLEGLWTADRVEAFIDRSKDEWSWTMMIRQPEWLGEADWEAVRDKAAQKDLTALEAVRLEPFEEHRAAQVMHVGSYDDEGPAIARMHQWIADHDLVERGVHHEIYIGDPRRSAPAKLKTVLRQPVSAR
jgi:hypothetical protein